MAVTTDGIIKLVRLNIERRAKCVVKRALSEQTARVSFQYSFNGSLNLISKGDPEKYICFLVCFLKKFYLDLNTNQILRRGQNWIFQNVAKKSLNSIVFVF